MTQRGHTDEHDEASSSDDVQSGSMEYSSFYCPFGHAEYRLPNGACGQQQCDSLGVYASAVCPQDETRCRSISAFALDAIRRIREEQGINQEEAAERCGLHRTYYSGIERGLRNVSLVNIEKVSKGLRTSLPELFKRI